jgi:hypothetical protein
MGCLSHISDIFYYEPDSNIDKQSLPVFTVYSITSLLLCLSASEDVFEYDRPLII